MRLASELVVDAMVEPDDLRAELVAPVRRRARQGPRIFPPSARGDPGMTTVLLAEDDPAISEPLARALQREGYAVLVRNDGASALSEAMSGDVALVVLDLGLPDMDGLEVCRRLRAGRNSVPVLVLTARTDEIDFVVGLDAGADDYVAKPFRLAELLARVRALLRRADRRRARGQRRADGAGLPPGLAGRRRAALSNKEFELLRVLLRQAGAVVTREAIMREVWDDPRTARPRRWTCTCPGCGASSATIRSGPGCSPPSAASASASSAAEHEGGTECAGGCSPPPWRWSRCPSSRSACPCWWSPCA